MSILETLLADTKACREIGWNLLNVPCPDNPFNVGQRAIREVQAAIRNIAPLPDAQRGAQGVQAGVAQASSPAPNLPALQDILTAAAAGIAALADASRFLREEAEEIRAQATPSATPPREVAVHIAAAVYMLPTVGAAAQALRIVADEISDKPGADRIRLIAEHLLL